MADILDTEERSKYENKLITIVKKLEKQGNDTSSSSTEDAEFELY